MHLVGDLLENLGTRDLIGQCSNNNFAALDVVGGTGLEAALTSSIKLQNFFLGRNEFRFSRIIWAFYVFAKIFDRGLGLVEQVKTGAGNLIQIMRRDIRRHADCDAATTVKQHVRQARRQHLRLVHRAIEVGFPVDSALSKLTQQHIGVVAQTRFGIAHGRERLGVVLTTPVALTIHQRVAIGKRLRHEHHGLVAGRITVGVELAYHVADGTGGFLELRRRLQAQLGHGVDDTSLHWLEAVAEIRQGAVVDDIHRIVEISLLGVATQCELFDAVFVDDNFFVHW